MLQYLIPNVLDLERLRLLELVHPVHLFLYDVAYFLQLCNLGAGNSTLGGVENRSAHLVAVLSPHVHQVLLYVLVDLESKLDIDFANTLAVQPQLLNQYLLVYIGEQTVSGTLDRFWPRPLIQGHITLPCQDVVLLDLEVVTLPKHKLEAGAGNIAYQHFPLHGGQQCVTFGAPDNLGIRLSDI